ncbi:MAG: glycoside hydrolase family 5 protein [Spirochaetes bacterium]|nr:glycoside hydrolase family 5 protein [Spirochaetota bacterium]
MKKNLHLILITLILIKCNSTDAIVPNDDLAEKGPVNAVLRTTPFSKGVNFSGWFEVNNAQRIPFTQYNEQDFANVKSLGADVIRLPVRLNDMTSGAPDYRLDPLLLKFLDTAVNWAEKYKLYIIIDNHSFHPVNRTPDDVDKVLIPVWAQIAQRYRDRSEYIVYEILNEPHGISDKRWGEIQGRAIEAIRRTDTKHLIIVGGTDYNSYNKLSSIPAYSDPNIIYTFHFYDPFMFTHQGASWSPPMEYLSGVPFPADPKRMPKLHSKLRGTWVESAMKDYPRDAVPSKLLGILDMVTAFSIERNVPVYCGEYGVYIPNSLPEDRVVWYQLITNALDNRKISRTSWDYFGGFGIFNFDGKGDFHSDVNINIVRAMGFTPPAQSPRLKEPIKSGFTLFDDYPNAELNTGFWGGADTDFSFYSTNSAEGEFAIRWENAGRYDAFWFSFPRNGDFTALVSNGYFLEFKACAEKPVQFDVRFIQSENESSIPWRMRYTINENNLPPDGKWHTIRIPINSMQEHGAWINKTRQWLNPQGKFTWDNIDRLEFAAEHIDMKGRRILFDSIKITR